MWNQDLLAGRREEETAISTVLQVGLRTYFRPDPPADPQTNILEDGTATVCALVHTFAVECG